jgi:microcystin-dependent protein
MEDGIDTAHSELETHKTSADHDGRYFTETESNANFLGKTAQAADSAKLANQLPTVYAPIGAVLAYAGSTAPDGWFECDGTTFNATTYPVLNTVLGGNTKPDLRGQFVRGWDHGKGTDAGRTIRSAQTDGVGPHNHTSPISQPTPNYTGGSPNKPYTAGGSLQTSNGSDGTTPTIAETRPKNIALMYIIRHD